GALLYFTIYIGGIAAAPHITFGRPTSVPQQLTLTSGQTLVRVAAMPTLADPRRWLCVAETDRAMYRFVVQLGSPLNIQSSQPGSEINVHPTIERFEKIFGNELVSGAARDPRAQALLSFARFPIARVEGDNCV